MSSPIARSTRRDLLRNGAAAAGLWALSRLPTSALGLADPEPDEQVVPFLDPQPDPQGKMTKWDELRGDIDWQTPTQRVFHVGHYPAPKPIDAEQWKLRVTGQVERPRELTLDEIKQRPKQDLAATLECSGNGSAPAFIGAIGNCRWVGTPLAPLLRECGIKDSVIEVAFWAVDSGKEKVRNQDIEQNFARSLPMKEAVREDVLLCYEMNGAPLPHDHGAPVRLVVPGWYGIAWVKWLQQIEARDRRLMTRFIAKDYVTLRAREEGGKQVWTETSVGPMNVKSIVARVTRRKDGPLHVTGAAWTQGRVKTVELKIDDGPWQKVTLDESHKDPHTWTFWSYDWKDAAPGEHTLVSRATDEQGRVQPTADDPEIKLKKTYWEAYAQVPRRIKL